VGKLKMTVFMEAHPSIDLLSVETYLARISSYEQVV
jgi:hypothetical protein